MSEQTTVNIDRRNPHSIETCGCCNVRWDVIDYRKGKRAPIHIPVIRSGVVP